MFGRLKYGSVTRSDVSGGSIYRQPCARLFAHIQTILGKNAIPDRLLCVPGRQNSLSVNSVYKLISLNTPSRRAVDKRFRSSRGIARSRRRRIHAGPSGSGRRSLGRVCRVSAKLKAGGGRGHSRQSRKAVQSCANTREVSCNCGPHVTDHAVMRKTSVGDALTAQRMDSPWLYILTHHPRLNRIRSVVEYKDRGRHGRVMVKASKDQQIQWSPPL